MFVFLNDIFLLDFKVNVLTIIGIILTTSVVINI